MKAYEFTLKFAIPDGIDTEALEARLFDNGCDDALLGVGQKGRLTLSFTRGAESAGQAVDSAISDVRRAVPQARLIEAAPDLVGVSDIADFFDCSRQNMRKLMQTHVDTFPLPLHEGRSSLWHLVDVLDWFAQRQGRNVDSMLREVARASMRVNAGREVSRLQTEADGSGLHQRTESPS